MTQVTRALAITQAGKVVQTYSDFTDNFTKNPVSEELVVLVNEDSVKQAIKNLLMTNPGERLFNPFFGSGVTGQLFELFTPFLVQSLTSNINVSVSQFEPRVNILDINITQTDDENDLQVSVTFSIVNRAPVTMSLFLQRVR
jgi:phage baseplate assembly protein W